jgi:drug/metabolite transporter (DMT)-like permease
MRHKQEHRTKGYTYVILASAFYAMIGIISKIVMNTGLTPYLLLTYQYIFTIFFLLIWILATDRKSLFIDRKSILLMLIQGIFGGFGTSLFFYLAITKISVGMATMILFLYPAIVNIFFAVSGVRKIGKASIIALGMALLGSFIVLNIFGIEAFSVSTTGIIFGIGACLSYAFYNIFADLKLSKFSPVTISFYSAISAFITSLIISPSFFKFDINYSWELIGFFALLALISGIFPSILMYKGITYIGADKASIVASTELPMTIILAYFFLSEKMSILQISGVALIVASVLLLEKADQLSYNKSMLAKKP